VNAGEDGEEEEAEGGVLVVGGELGECAVLYEFGKFIYVCVERRGGMYTYALGMKCLFSQMARGGIVSRGVGREESDVEGERSSMRLRIVRRRERKTGHQWARRCWLWWRWLKALRMGRRGVKGAAVSGGDDAMVVVCDVD
jgi:hypothetical protein